MSWLLCTTFSMLCGQKFKFTQKLLPCEFLLLLIRDLCPPPSQFFANKEMLLELQMSSLSKHFENVSNVVFKYIYIQTPPLETGWARARICKLFKEPKNRFPVWRSGTTTLFVDRPDWLHRLAELVPWNRFLGSLKV